MFESCYLSLGNVSQMHEQHLFVHQSSRSFIPTGMHTIKRTTHRRRDASMYSSRSSEAIVEAGDAGSIFRSFSRSGRGTRRCRDSARRTTRAGPAASPAGA